MQSGNWAAYAAGVAIVVLSAASTAQEQPDRFVGITDAVPSRFFDAATSRPDPYNPNRLIIGLNTGMDWTTWKATDFRASTAAYSYGTAMDTISFTFQAPQGFCISSIAYTQRGSGSVLRSGRAAGSVNWVVGGFSADIGTFGTNPTGTSTIDLSASCPSSVPVSITNSLFAYAPPYLGSATVGVTSAEVVVQLRFIE